MNDRHNKRSSILTNAPRPRFRAAWTAGIAVGLTLVACLSVGRGQDQPAPKPQAVPKAKAAAPANPNPKNGGLPAKRGPLTPPPKKVEKKALDPLLKAGAANDAMFHYIFKLTTPERVSLSAHYYPSRLADKAPAAFLIHEKDRSGRDFEEPIADLKGQTFAEHLQSLGYAVLVLDLRGHGANTRTPLTPRDWGAMPGDLQCAYRFLVERHNRGELNLAKLSVVAIGDGANLAAFWAAGPGGAVSSDDRPSDIAALVLISPMPEFVRYRFESAAAALAARVPMLILCGERDKESSKPVLAAKPLVERSRLSRVEMFPTSLHGFKLLRLEPKAATAITRYLETNAKLRLDEWEPRYNLLPSTISDITTARNAKAKPVPKPPAPAVKKEAK